MAESFRQEMPPKAGFGSVIFERIPLKKPWSGLKLFSIWLVVTSGSFYVYSFDQQYVKYVRREDHDISVALEPLLIAERDRMYLNQLRKNRDDERDLMKDVPGWEVGTLYGIPLFKTIQKGKFARPIREEYYAHAHPWSPFYQHLYDSFF